MWCSVHVEEDEDGGVDLETTVSSVPSLGLLSCNLAQSQVTRSEQRQLEEEEGSLQSQELWRHLKVKTCIEIMSTLYEWRMLRRTHEAFQLIKRAVTSKVLLCASKQSFSSKVRSFVNLVERLQTGVIKEYPDCQGLIATKVRRIIDLDFYDCDPKCHPKKSKLPNGIFVHGREEGGTLGYICCLCPFESCKGGCSVSFKSVPRVKVIANKKSEGVDDEEQEEEETFAISSCYVDRDDDDDDKEEEEEVEGGNGFDFIESPSSEACSTYSYTEDKVIFSFVTSDYEAAHNFLASQSDPSGWTATKATEREIVLSRSWSDEVVVASFSKERRRFVRCIVSGQGLEQFSEEVVPNVVKLTSCKLVEEGDDEEDTFAADCVKVEMNGFYDNDDDIDDSSSYTHSESEPTEMVFVEESPSASSFMSTWRKPRSKSIHEFQCRGCRAKFKYKNSYLKHEAKCGLAGVAPDIRAFPLLPDGRKPCPGCGKAFASVNLFFLKHVRACPKVKPEGFPCKSCQAPFSTYKTMSRHFALCPKRGLSTSKRKSQGNGDAGIPQLTKQPKVEGAHSLRSDLVVPQMPRAAPAQTRSTWVNKVEKYEPVCKVGDYTCPLCLVKFRLNQPYGRHVKNQECLKGRQEVKAPPKNKFAMLNITIHPGIKGDDTVVAYNRVSLLFTIVLSRYVVSKKKRISVCSNIMLAFHFRFQAYG